MLNFKRASELLLAPLHRPEQPPPLTLIAILISLSLPFPSIKNPTTIPFICILSKPLQTQTYIKNRFHILYFNLVYIGNWREIISSPIGSILKKSRFAGLLVGPGTPPPWKIITKMIYLFVTKVTLDEVQLCVANKLGLIYMEGIWFMILTWTTYKSTTARMWKISGSYSCRGIDSLDGG
ncbi:unnamed protein product [Lactuca saligna]|uniref:Uncharacterized protein n=1 Tax=Lactuca saligna TaxID=75948 RepID=A0AA35YKB1_LACSI|nr:unnamed protein product [Lactuca saligna]